MKTTTNVVAMTAEERALHWIKSGLRWEDYCQTHRISSFGETREATRIVPVRDSRTMPRLAAKGLVAVCGGFYVLTPAGEAIAAAL